MTQTVKKVLAVKAELQTLAGSPMAAAIWKQPSPDRS